MRFFIFILILLWPHASLAARHALVIGNDRYDHVSVLQKAGNDARAVSDRLNGLGFTTITAQDLTRREMNKTLSGFLRVLQPGDTAMVFYAGHGVQIDGENYLLPTDIEAPSAGGRDFIKFEAFALSDLIETIRKTGAKTTIAIIDACRDNPFPDTVTRSLGLSRGLTRMTATQGTFVMYSAGAGQTALDRLGGKDTDPNSVFTRALLTRLDTPGLELRRMINDLRREVRETAKSIGHNQFPAYYDELLEEFYFSQPPATNSEPRKPANPPVTEDPIRKDFALTRSIGTASAFEAFLTRYGDRTDDFTVGLARDMLAGMTASEPAPGPAPKPQNTKAIIRSTQSALNRAGCSAGVADGISGRRTRAAVTRYANATGAGFTPADIGSQALLDHIGARSGTICKTVAQAPAPTPATEAPATAKPFTMAGSWSASASCAFGVKTTSTTRFTPTGGNTYRATIRDSLGQTGRMTASLNGTTLTGATDWGNVRDTFRATVNKSAGTYSGTTSLGCRFTARR